jgi:hypothetical protein
VGDDPDKTWSEFREVVNLTPQQLREWLETDDARRVGQKPTEGGESVGHHSGRRIIAILETQKSDLTDDDYAHMRKVVSYVHRHLAQRPSGDITETDWRYSLMNWGHDPAK